MTIEIYAIEEFELPDEFKSIVEIVPIRTEDMDLLLEFMKLAKKVDKYKHQESCKGKTQKQPKQPKIPKIKAIEPVEEIEDIEDIEDEILAAPPTIQPVKRPTSLCPMAARQNKINQKKEQFKALFANAI